MAAAAAAPKPVPLPHVNIGEDRSKRPAKPRNARASPSDFIFSGSTRTRRLRVPEYLRKNPILFRRPHGVKRHWTEKLLNADCMLKCAGVDTPRMVERLVLSDQELTGVMTADMPLFTSLKYLDVGDNNIGLNQLGLLPSLRELHLHCNGISQIQLDIGTFPELRILGLGYNQLSPDAMENLTKIAKLEELDLTYNGIVDIPQGMSAFASLKKLSLRRNLIRNDSIWQILGNISNLQVLDISENALRGISSDFLRGANGFHALTFLDISYNFISTESNLLALAGFGCLEVVDVRGNPLVKPSRQNTALKDDYPMLYSNLVEPCDLNIIIHDPSSESDFDHILKPDHANDTDQLEQDKVEETEEARLGPDETFMTSLNAECEPDGEDPFRLDASSFADTDLIEVGQAYRLLRESYDKPLIYHTSKAKRNYEKKTQAAIQRESHPTRRRPEIPSKGTYIHSIFKSKKFQIPRPIAMIKLDQQLEKRLESMKQKEDSPRVPEAIKRPIYNEIEDVLNLIISKLQSNIER